MRTTKNSKQQENNTMVRNSPGSGERQGPNATQATCKPNKTTRSQWEKRRAKQHARDNVGEERRRCEDNGTKAEPAARKTTTKGVAPTGNANHPKRGKRQKLSRPRLQAETGEKLHAPRPIAAERIMREVTEPRQEKAQAEPKRHQPQKAKGKADKAKPVGAGLRESNHHSSYGPKTPREPTGSRTGRQRPRGQPELKGEQGLPKDKWLAPRIKKLPP